MGIYEFFLSMKNLKGILLTFVMLINTVALVTLLLFFAVLKLILPIQFVQALLSKILIWIAELWIDINSVSNRMIHGNKIKVEPLPELAKDQWYLVVANHQSAADIPIIQAVFNHKIPFLKFFIKKELIWVPFLGLAWWALDFPFMRRYSKEFLKKYPDMRGKDFEQTKKSCEKFKWFPTSVISFIEGTRLTEAKHKKQKSPFEYLLKPKAGGVGLVLGSMGEQMNQLLLVTLAYENKVPGMWDFLCGNYHQAVLKCEKIVIPDTLLNKNYQSDENFKTELFKWSQDLWYKQDKKLKDFYERTNI